MSDTNQPWWHYRPRTQQGKSLFASTLIALGALLASSLLMFTGPSSEPEQAKEKAWPVSTLVVQSAEIAPTFRAYGKVQSRSVAKLSTDLSATVAQVTVSEGETVQQGQLLVALDDSEYQLRLAEATADLAERRANLASMQSELAHAKTTAQQHQDMQRIAQAKLARHQQLMRDRLISQSLFDEALRSASRTGIEYQRHQQQLKELPHRVAAAKAQVAKAKALQGRAKINLSKTQILAPFNGPVLSVSAAMGDRLLPGTIVATVADSESFELRVPVPEAYVSRLQGLLGAATPATIEGQTDTGFTFHLSRLAGSVAAGQSGVDGFFALAPNGAQLPATGQVLELEIKLPARERVVALPPQAIYENQRVYAVVDNRLKSIEVARVGESRTNQGAYQVLVSAHSINDGAEVITTQLPKAMQGLLVEPMRQSIESLSRGDVAEPVRLPQRQEHATPAVMQPAPASKPEAKAPRAKRLPTLV